MTRRRWILGGVVAAAVLLVLVGFFWVDLAMAMAASGAESEFVKSFSAGSELRIVKHPADWAIEFGGRRGLPALERLAGDSRLEERGRQTAREVETLIRAGGHLKYAEEAMVHSGFVRRAMLSRILERDRTR
jgi:hypothetical protein